MTTKSTARDAPTEARCPTCGSANLFTHGRCDGFQQCEHSNHITTCNDCKTPFSVHRMGSAEPPDKRSTMTLPCESYDDHPAMYRQPPEPPSETCYRCKGIGTHGMLLSGKKIQTGCEICRGTGQRHELDGPAVETDERWRKVSVDKPPRLLLVDVRVHKERDVYTVSRRKLGLLGSNDWWYLPDGSSAGHVASWDEWRHIAAARTGGTDLKPLTDLADELEGAESGSIYNDTVSASSIRNECGRKLRATIAQLKPNTPRQVEILRLADEHRANPKFPGLLLAAALVADDTAEGVK